MSRHGASGVPHGAYPGQPGEPHGAYPGQPGEPYDPPSDPWGQGEGSWSDLTAPQLPGAPAAPPPPYESDGYPRQPGWDPLPPPGASPGPEPERRGNLLLFLAVGILVLVVAAAVGYALYLLSGEETGSGAGPGPSGQPAPATAPGPDSTQDNTGMNAAMARVGDCAINLGTDTDAQLEIVPCDSEQTEAVYRVLSRSEVLVDGANKPEQDKAAHEVCQDTEGYTHHFFDVNLPLLLCMTDEPAPE